MHVQRNDPTTRWMLAAFPSYKGKMFRVESCERVSLTGAYWSGGSRVTYKAIKLDTLEISEADAKIQNPFRVPEAPTVELVAGHGIVAHTISQGKDLGLTLYIRPENMVPLVTVAVEPDVLKVLVATRSYKACYGGDKNYRQRNSGLGPVAWDRAKELAIELGYLDKRGAITIEGRNVSEGAKCNY